MVVGVRMAPPSPFVTLAIICVSLSISEAFLALTSSSRYSQPRHSAVTSSATSSASKLWRILKSSLPGSSEDDAEDSPFTAEVTSGRWRRASENDVAVAGAYSSSGAILTGMAPGPGNSDASFENVILTVVQKEKMKIRK